MAKPFKFRYVNEIVGAFVLIVAAAMLVAVILMGRAQGWFEPEYTLRVKFPEEGSYGVKKGAAVSILETQVGTVNEVGVNPDGTMEGILKIRGRFIQFIRSDSWAILKKQFGVAGDAFIEITRGYDDPLPSGSALPNPAVRDTQIVELVQDLVKQVKQVLVPLLEQVQKAAEEYTLLAKDLRDPQGHVQQTLAHLNGVTAGLERGEGTAGKLLKDPSTANNVNDAVTSLKASLAELQRIMADVKAATADLPEMAGQTRETLREAEILMEGIQKHWLLRKYMEPAPSSGRISPSEVGAQEGAKP